MHPADPNGDSPRITSFTVGEWTVAPARNLLLRGDEQVRLEPRVMDVLVVLADHAGDVVSKEDLVQRVWDGRYVTDEVLTVAISALRKALGDAARQPRYIETVSRRGYRLVATVAPAHASGMATHVEAPTEVAAPRARTLSWRAAAAVAVLALVAAGMGWIARASRQHVPSAEAHEAYVKGRYFLDQRSIRAWRQALEQFERAAAIDPQYPAAQAGLADTYSAMSDFGVASPAEMRPRAMSSARRALDLDRRSAAAHAALGRAQFFFDWDFDAAERSLARAVALDPDYMPAYQTIAWLESARGRHDRAIGAAERALQLDPVNTARYLELAYVFALAGRYDEARRQADRALQLNPRSFESWLMKGWTLEMSGQPDAAFAAYRDALRLGGVSDEALDRIDAVYRADGLRGYYRNWLDRRDAAGPMSETWRAQLYVRVGELDRAIESLEHAYEKREGALAWVNVEPAFQPLRADARFQQIVARVAHHQ